MATTTASALRAPCAQSARSGSRASAAPGFLSGAPLDMRSEKFIGARCAMPHIYLVDRSQSAQLACAHHLVPPESVLPPWRSQRVRWCPPPPSSGAATRPPCARRLAMMTSASRTQPGVTCSSPRLRRCAARATAAAVTPGCTYWQAIDERLHRCRRLPPCCRLPRPELPTTLLMLPHRACPTLASWCALSPMLRCRAAARPRTTPASWPHNTAVASRRKFGKRAAAGLRRFTGVIYVIMLCTVPSGERSSGRRNVVQDGRFLCGCASPPQLISSHRICSVCSVTPSSCSDICPARQSGSILCLAPCTARLPIRCPDRGCETSVDVSAVGPKARA